MGQIICIKTRRQISPDQVLPTLANELAQAISANKPIDQSSNLRQAWDFASAHMLAKQVISYQPYITSKEHVQEVASAVVNMLAFGHSALAVDALHTLCNLGKFDYKLKNVLYELLSMGLHEKVNSENLNTIKHMCTAPTVIFPDISEMLNDYGLGTLDSLGFSRSWGRMKDKIPVMRAFGSQIDSGFEHP